MYDEDSDNSDDYDLEVTWSAGSRTSKVRCVCNSEWRCRCQVKLTPVPKK